MVGCCDIGGVTDIIRVVVAIGCEITADFIAECVDDGDVGDGGSGTGVDADVDNPPPPPPPSPPRTICTPVGVPDPRLNLNAWLLQQDVF